MFFLEAENSAMRKTRSNANASNVFLSLVSVTDRLLPREPDINFFQMSRSRVTR